MKVLILAGGLGSRLGEETHIKPKPMVEIGGYPIIWHIMKIYSHYGFNEFVVLTGYKQEVIKDHFLNYFVNNSNITVDLSSNNVEVHSNACEPWKVTLLYTGRETLTGGRIKKAQDFIGNEPFMLTYGDGVGDINIKELIDFHKKSGKLCTLTSVCPKGRYGVVELLEDNTVINFQEKPHNDNTWVNGGFFVCEPQVFDYITEGDETIWEKAPLRNLAKEGKLGAYKHSGFWHSMDMLKDKEDLNKMWSEKQAPWKIWDK